MLVEGDVIGMGTGDLAPGRVEQWTEPAEDLSTEAAKVVS
jgi:hypothetical protein